ncbi:glycoside hydrolase family 3 C-terminal domain-containing protein [Butyrivibrio sp. NC3005]|uniref:glycoside hydrolase family 3 C-terminal domain-containing protein n=1 Tax=Butyrivibrio sp. NC3005 TaxID=1280685 RepID=UPI00042423F6|nr:glycoside hydrolase family 3 C-terminal domain-containing protein [Butyrivibrio sp. NC3005]
MELIHNDKKQKEYEDRARELVSKMTLDEKVSQTLNHAAAIERLGIKAYDWWNEGLHGVARAGVATVFPQAIGLAATFDEDLAEEVADAVSTEARAKYNMQQKYNDTDIYKGLTFWSPNVNIFRDPRWGRGQETFGEDPYLTTRMGVRYVEGLQGHDENYLKVAACAKHFAVHSGPELLRHKFNATCSKRDLWETYLPAFEACVKEAKVEAVMGAYNRTNGEPCCGSKTLLQDILRDMWGFKGHVTSDCWAIRDFHTGHMVTSNEVESVSMAMNNGCDINCGDLFVYLKQAVEEGKVSEQRLDEALTYLFTCRMKLGMFDGEGATPFDNIPYTVVDSAKMRELNLKTSEKCIVMLKNENNFLPLDKNKIHTIGVVGPNADSRKALVGNYEGTASRYVTVLEGIEDYVGDDVRVLYSEACHLWKDRVSGLSQGDDRISEVKGVCEASDVVVCCLGLDAEIEGEEGDTGNEYAGGDKINLNLVGLQEEVLETCYASGKPVILVLMTGSAMSVNWADDHVAAILQAWYPGAQGGKAIAEILFGDKNPEGKLPVTFYRSAEELPEFTDYSMEGRTYRYMRNEALYPFGFGLSYTNFDISAKLSSDHVGEDGIDIAVSVKNTGKMDGAEAVQIYVKREDDDTLNWQLKAFAKVSVKAGEVGEKVLHLPKKAFGLYDEEGTFHVNPGKVTIFVGGQQPDERSKKLLGREVLRFEAVVD